MAQSRNRRTRPNERTDEIVFLFDCDNTLLDNDRVQEDLRAHLAREFGAESRDRYWTIFETLRAELGYADYLGALQRYRLGDLNDHAAAADVFISGRLSIRRAGCTLAHSTPSRRLRAAGPTVILSDGDVVFQPLKIERSGLWEAVEGRVLIYIHKEEMLDAVAERYPARHYVMIDDKLRILAAMKKTLERPIDDRFPAPGTLRARSPTISPRIRRPT